MQFLRLGGDLRKHFSITEKNFVNKTEFSASQEACQTGQTVHLKPVTERPDCKGTVLRYKSRIFVNVGLQWVKTIWTSRAVRPVNILYMVLHVGIFLKCRAYSFGCYHSMIVPFKEKPLDVINLSFCKRSFKEKKPPSRCYHSTYNGRSMKNSLDVLLFCKRSFKEKNLPL